MRAARNRNDAADQGLVVCPREQRALRSGVGSGQVRSNSLHRQSYSQRPRLATPRLAEA